MSTSPLKLVHFVEDQDLRDIRWNQLVLEQLVADYKEETGMPLRHAEAIVYCNVAQDRFRLVTMFYQIPVLILPPVNPVVWLCLLLLVYLFLKKFAPKAKVLKSIEGEIETVKERMDRRSEMAKKAKGKRQ